MRRVVGIVAGALSLFGLIGPASAEQVSGRVGAGAPEDLFLHLTMAANGTLTISQTEFKLAWGGYYRFNLECPDAGPKNEASVQFVVPNLWENSHIRLASVSERKSGFQEVGEVNFHLQGLQLRLMECEGLPLDVRFSFHPMRKGTYPFTVTNSTVKPPVEYKGKFVVE